MDDREVHALFGGYLLLLLLALVHGLNLVIGRSKEIETRKDHSHTRDEPTPPESQDKHHIQLPAPTHPASTRTHPENTSVCEHIRHYLLVALHVVELLEVDAPTHDGKEDEVRLQERIFASMMVSYATCV